MRTQYLHARKRFCAGPIFGNHIRHQSLFPWNILPGNDHRLLHLLVANELRLDLSQLNPKPTDS